MKDAIQCVFFCLQAAMHLPTRWNFRQRSSPKSDLISADLMKSALNTSLKRLFGWRKTSGALVVLVTAGAPSSNLLVSLPLRLILPSLMLLKSSGFLLVGKEMSQRVSKR